MVEIGRGLECVLELAGLYSMQCQAEGLCTNAFMSQLPTHMYASCQINSHVLHAEYDLKCNFLLHTLLMLHELSLAPLPDGGSTNAPTGESSATSLPWMKKPLKVGLLPAAERVTGWERTKFAVIFEMCFLSCLLLAGLLGRV